MELLGGQWTLGFPDLVNRAWQKCRHRLRQCGGLEIDQR